MFLKISNSSFSCSTLVLGGFNLFPEKFTVKDFVERFLEVADEVYDDGSLDYDEDCEHLEWSDYAFVIASIDTGSYFSRQNRAMEIMKELGFTFAAPTYNNKNGTTVSIGMISVPDLFKAITKVLTE